MSKTCPYCGNNPVPHFYSWYNETLNIYLTPLRQQLLYNPLTRWLKRQGWGQGFARSALAVGKGLRIIGVQNDVTKCKVRRAQVLWEEANKRGFAMSELLLFGKPFDCYIAEKDYPLSLIPNLSPSRIKDLTFAKATADKKGLRIIFSGLPRPKDYSNNWLDLMDDKWLLKQKFMEFGLPVPAGAAVTSFSEAKDVLKKIEKPVIVKPRSGSRGRHSTTFVYTEAELKLAFKIGKQLCHWVMVEEQLFGPVYRATLINFELCGVLRGDPPQVIGDGHQTIDALIKVKNSSAHPGVKDIVLDSGMKLFLSRQKLDLVSVPPSGQLINLSEKIGVNYGGSSSEDFDICHPENKQLFSLAAKVLGDPIVGFDFIIPDITKSYKQQKCGFIEVNSLPFINLHHDPLHGRPRNVAAKVWDMVGI